MITIFHKTTEYKFAFTEPIQCQELKLKWISHSNVDICPSDFEFIDANSYLIDLRKLINPVRYESLYVWERVAYPIKTETKSCLIL